MSQFIFLIFKKVVNTEIADKAPLDQILAILNAHSLLLNELKADVLAIGEKRVEQSVVYKFKQNLQNKNFLF
jgi:hypothetical protein